MMHGMDGITKPYLFVEYGFHNFNLIINNFKVDGRDLISSQFSRILLVLCTNQSFRFISKVVRSLFPF